MHRNDDPVWEDEYIPDPGHGPAVCEICKHPLENPLHFICADCWEETKRLLREEEELDASLGSVRVQR